MTLREPPAMYQTRRVRVSRNTLCERVFPVRHKKVADFRNAMFPGFAQSSPFSVALQSVEREL